MAKKVRNGLTQKQRKTRNKRGAKAIYLYLIHPNPPMRRNWKANPYGTGRGESSVTDQSMRGRTGLGSLPRPKLQPGAIHALLWMLYMAELTQYGVPHQLTAGPTCSCYPMTDRHRVCDVHGCWHCGAWPPAWPSPPVPPCSCRYRVYTTSVVLTVRRRPVRRRLVTGTGFEIDPGCEHHGDLRREEYIDATYLDVLDEAERRGD